MKKYATLLLIMLLAMHVYANDFYKQLCDFNYNWKKYTHYVQPEQKKHFNNDAVYVQTHLSHVIPILKSNPTFFLTHKQRVNRIKLIHLLEIYCEEGLFPVNNYREDRIPVFIDEYNTHCAVGHLLEKTGYENLAQRIARNNNYAWVKEIDDPDLLAWQKTSGLSLEELKLIQGAYDFYPVLDLHDPNKYEIPQKPEYMTLYFDRDKSSKTKEKKIWCKGEGKDGILHGRWEQNYSETLPWIVGYFNKGKRTGQWKEYYQGTDKLCRTENWRNNLLNGVRKRFNKAGEIIEEILFKNGKAVTKTNYDLHQSLKFIRTPLDSSSVWTEVYTIGGSILGEGKERIHNPGNLMWFQNIELTALNTAAITSRELQKTTNHRGREKQVYMNPESGTGLYNAPPLVEYKKEGQWIYYKDYASKMPRYHFKKYPSVIINHYPYIAQQNNQVMEHLKSYDLSETYDSIVVNYENNRIHNFYGYGENDFIHITIAYHIDRFLTLDINSIIYGGRHSQYDFPSVSIPRIKMMGTYNQNNKRIGTWTYYDLSQQVYKTEKYLIPWKEEENENVVVN